MSISHPENIVIVFPQDEEDFQPFELVSRMAHPTQTRSGISVDAVQYQLRTFEMIPHQAVLLPYAYLIGTDTIRQFIRSDSLEILFRVAEDTETTTFEAFEGIIPLSSPPNYHVWIVVGIVLLILLGIASFALRRPIDRYLKLQRLKQEWADIQRQFRKLEKYPEQASQFDQLNHLWKTYLDPKDKIGLRSMTTTELQNNLPLLMYLTRAQKDLLLTSAKMGDQVIYAGEEVPQEELKSLIWDLYEIIDAAYQERREVLSRKS